MSQGDKSIIIKDIELIPYLHMVWNNPRNENGELTYKGKPEGESEEMMFDGEEALSHLLATSQVFINDHWWMGEQDNPWPVAACKTFSINANCNDIFCWGCADTEEVQFRELEDLYTHYHKDPQWGVAIWCIKKRGVMPQKPVEDAIRKCRVWNLDEMNLEENPIEKYYASKQSK